eukprot:RCo023478
MALVGGGSKLVASVTSSRPVEGHTAYIVEVSTNMPRLVRCGYDQKCRSYTLERFYSDFQQLHSAMTAAGVKLPEMPSKSGPFWKPAGQRLSARMEIFDLMLQQVIRSASSNPAATAAVVSFFTLPATSGPTSAREDLAVSPLTPPSPEKLPPAAADKGGDLALSDITVGDEHIGATGRTTSTLSGGRAPSSSESKSEIEERRVGKEG